MMRRLVVPHSFLIALCAAAGCNEPAECSAPTVTATCRVEEYAVTPFFPDGSYGPTFALATPVELAHDVRFRLATSSQEERFRQMSGFVGEQYVEAFALLGKMTLLADDACFADLDLSSTVGLVDIACSGAEALNVMPVYHVEYCKESSTSGASESQTTLCTNRFSGTVRRDYRFHYANPAATQTLSAVSQGQPLRLRAPFDCRTAAGESFPSTLDAIPVHELSLRLVCDWPVE